MKTTFLSTLLAFLTIFSVTAGNQNIANLITSSDWDALFPNRAQAGHPQGATDDFYSYAKFTSAVDEISNYSDEVAELDSTSFGNYYSSR